MLITTVCPRCQTSYQVQDSLLGKPMRCPRLTCRNVFLVERPAPRSTAPEPPTATGGQSGSVGDLVPLLPVEEDNDPITPHVGDVLELLPSEPAEEALPLELIEPDRAEPAPDWSAPPPVRRRDREPPPEPEDGPRIVEATDWNAPPVRRRNPEADTEPVRPRSRNLADAEVLAPADHDEPGAYQPRSRWVKWAILPLVLLSLGGLGAGVVVVLQTFRQTEEKLAAEADDFFAQGQYPAAKQTYEALAGRFPESEHLERYRYRSDMATLLQQLAEAGEGEIDEVIDHAGQVLQERRKDPKLTEDLPVLGRALVKVVVEYANRAKQDPRNEEPLKSLERAGKVLARARALKLPKDTPEPPPWEQVEQATAEFRALIEKTRERDGILARLQELARTPSYRAILDVENYLREIQPAFPELPESPEVKKLLDNLHDGHLAGIRYLEEPPQVRRLPRAEEHEPTLFFDPPLPGTLGRAPGDDGVVLALTRGVLCALSRATGKVLWARRVGIDTTALPVRLPARAGSQERLLVLSSDTRTLTALDLAGRELWRYRLNATVLGRPVVVEQRAYLATYDPGEVHEIELIEGKLLGRYPLGQRLTLGGTLEPGTRRVYFPADDGCIYILDVEKRRCERILYSRHPAGSLRGAPILLPGQGDDFPGYLVLEQAEGLDRVRLRVFDLPVRNRHAEELVLRPPALLRGWTWFNPYHDAEKLLLLTDAGSLGLFGIHQARTRDQALFPLLPAAESDSRDDTVGRDLASLLFPGRKDPPRPRARSEVVQVQGNDLWVLASDRLQRLRVVWDTVKGPRLETVWKHEKNREVGSPIHASQFVEDPTGQTSLVLVTRPPNRSCTWVSCFDDESGRLLWKRQLGLVCQGEPIPLAVPGGEPLWLACDQSGALFALDPTRHVAGGAGWLIDGKGVLLADSLEENPDQPPLILPGDEGHSAFVLVFSGDGRDLVVRQVKAAAEGRRLEVSEGRVRLTAPLAGQPALVGPQLILPLADGLLYRLTVPVVGQADPPDSGENWRADRAPSQARSQVVPLGGARFLATDGARGLLVLEWQGNTWTRLPPNRDEGPTLELKDRVLGATLVPGKSQRLAVSDSAGGLSLVEVRADGSLVLLRTWDLGGPLTAGPFVRATPAGARIGGIVDRSRLVWIDPDADGLAWQYTTPGDDAIVGEPALAGEVVVTADQSGLYIGLDVRTGKPVGPGYQLRGSIAPAASPVAFQKDRLLAPLSDGTLLLLAQRRLHETRKK